MSGTLAPTNRQSPVRFDGIDLATDVETKSFSKAVAKKEYVAGGFYDKDVNLVLYRQSDVLLSKFGDVIVETMLRDPEIKKCETLLKVGILSDGISFYPAISKPQPYLKKEKGVRETKEEKSARLEAEREMERYLLSEKYAKFATRAIENLDTPFVDIIENMLDAILYGNKVAEQTYESKYDKYFKKDVLTLSSIRVKGRGSVRFVINKYKKLVGFEVDAKDKDNNQTKIVLPREKFVVLTFRGVDGDPRGKSILEAVYNAWYLKMQVWPEYLRWLLQCAIPSLVGYTAPEGESRVYLRDAEGNLVRDVNNNPIYEADTESLLNALVQVRNATAIALPYGSKVEPISNSVSGDPFKGMIDVLNEEIEMGLILQTLATSEGKYMSRASATTHMSVLDQFVYYLKEKVINMIRRDILTPLFAINFANFDSELLPRVSMGDVERREWATDATAAANLYRSGLIGESQLVGLDKMLGLPERDIESDRRKSSNESVSDVPEGDNV